jgi:serine/threonine-protein phosphatase CPPED1
MRTRVSLIISIVFPGLFAGAVFADNTNIAERPFLIAQLSDPQLGFGGYQHDVNTFQQAVNHINMIKPDFVVICGDLVHDFTDQAVADFKKIKSQLTIPCYITPGNHDVGDKPTVESLARYRQTFGPDYFSFEHKGYTFIIANSQLWKAPLAGESEAHDLWFKQTLEAAHDVNSPVFVVQHIPVYMVNPNEPNDTYYNLPTAKRLELLGLMVDNGVVAVLGGHRHQLIINNYMGIQLVNSEATSTNSDGRPLGFRIWQVRSPVSIKNAFVPLIPEQPVADFDNDYKIGLRDFERLAQSWLQDDPSVDIVPEPFGDGIVDFRDMAVLAEYWLKDIHLSAYWKLDETAGDIAYDSAVAPHNGNLMGQPIWQPAGGMVGGALLLDGDDDYVSTDFILDPSKGSFRVFAWIKGGQPGEVIISQKGSSGRSWLCTDAQTGALMTDLRFPGRASKSLVSQYIITDNQWHYIGVVWDGSYRSLYADGLEVAKDSEKITGLIGSTGGLYLGAGNTLEASGFFTGLIDEIRIYDPTVKP